MKKYKEYHVFTKDNDEWTKDHKKALKLFDIWKKEFGYVRLFEEMRDKDGGLLSEKEVKRFGKI